MRSQSDSSKEENDQYYLVAIGRMEMFTWLKQINLLGVKMLFEIRKAMIAFLFQTIFLYFRGYSTTYLVLNHTIAEERSPYF